MELFKLSMGFQLKVTGILVLLLALSFCQGKNVTVKVVGLMHCRERINKAFLGLNVSIRCKAANQEKKTHGNGAIDIKGNFNITLSTEILKDGSSILGCYATLQNASDSTCPIQSVKVASMKLVVSEDNATQESNNMMHRLIKFSPVTCQSAFFWPFINYISHPNITCFPNLPPSPWQGQQIGYAPPPIQRPPVDLIPPPTALTSPPYLPPIRSAPPALSPLVPAFGSIPSPQPHLNFKVPPPPLLQRLPMSPSPQNPPKPAFKISPPPPLSTLYTPPFPPPPPASSIFNQPLPPPKTFHQTPSMPPILAPNAPPSPILAPNAPSPQNPYPTSPPPPLASSNPRNYRKPNPIPRAPPVPKLPPVPTVPRKYYNQPKSKSQPPHPSDLSHS